MTSRTWTGAFRVAPVIALFAVSLITAQGSLAAEVHASTRFVGPKVNCNAFENCRAQRSDVVGRLQSARYPGSALAGRQSYTGSRFERSCRKAIRCSRNDREAPASNECLRCQRGRPKSSAGT